MLARMNLDPWQVAADLAARPVGAAERQPATMILSMPGWTADLWQPSRMHVLFDFPGTSIAAQEVCSAAISFGEPPTSASEGA